MPAITNLQDFPVCIVYRGSTQTIATGSTEVEIAWDSEETDSDVSNPTPMHDTSTNNGRIYTRTAGIYAFHVQIRWAVNATGERNITLKKNGNQIGRHNKESDNGADDLIMQAMVVNVMAADDYFSVSVTQRSGGDLLIRSGPAACRAAVWRIG